MPGAGLEPARDFVPGDFKSPASAIPPPRREATPGFEPGNSGFANRRLSPLGYVAVYFRIVSQSHWTFKPLKFRMHKVALFCLC